jgi:homoserine kinase
VVSLKIVVPATSANLGSGFDTLGLALDLNNEAVIEKSKYKSLSIFGNIDGNKKIKQDNMFVKIFTKQYKYLTNEQCNFAFKLSNNIPISRGLGSSSATIVSALQAAYTMAEVEISKQDLINKALVLEPHPDNIAPAIFGGFTTSVVEHKKVLTLQKDIPEYLRAIIVIPDKHMSTYRSRQKLPNTYPSRDVVYNISRSSLMTAAFFSENWDFLRSASLDRVHQYYRMRTFPELFNVQKTALANGALMSTLSGSGSSFFSIAHEDDAKRVSLALENMFPRFVIKTLRFNNTGLNVK